MSDAIQIMIMSGPDDGLVLRLSEPHAPEIGYVLGRRDECDVSFPYDRWVSGRHARVFRAPDTDGWLVEDLGSTNHTYVAQVRADGSFSGRDRVDSVYPITPGQLIQIGRVWIRIQELQASSTVHGVS